MDTGDLTNKTYKAIIIEAECFHHELTIQFGLLSEECADEMDFIKMSIELINEMMEFDQDDIENVFYENPPELAEFRKALNKILCNISALSQ